MFSNITPYRYHTGSPDLGINAYSFCLQPENDEVSMIDRKSIYMKMTFETNEVLEVSLKI